MASDPLASGLAKALGGDRKQFDMFFNKMLDGFAYHKIVIDKAGKPVDYVFLEVNDAFERMTGLKRERIIGKRVTKVISGMEKDVADWIGVYGRVALSGKPAKFETYSEPVGKWLRIEAYCPEKGHFVALYEDITERKEAEEALSESEAQLRAYVTSSSDVAYRMSSDWSVMCQLSDQDFIADTDEPDRLWMEKYIHPDDRQHVMAVIQHSIETKSIFELEHRVIRVDGSLGWTFSRVIPLLDKDGKIVQWFGTAKDVTERKKTGEAMAFQDSLLSMAREAIFGVDSKYNITYWNKGSEDLLGWTKDEVMGKNFQELLPIKIESSSRAEELAKVEALGHWEGEVQYRRKDGSYVSVELSTATLRSPKGELLGVVTAARDITERKQQEREIKNIAKFPSENPNPIFRLDRNGTILFGNSAGNSLLTLWKSKVGEQVPEHINRVVAEALGSNKKIEIEETYGAKTFSLILLLSQRKIT